MGTQDVKGTHSGLTLVAAATGFTVAGGTSSKTLTVADTVTFTKGLTVTTNAGTLAFSAASKTLTVNESVTLNAQPVGGLSVATSANVIGSLAVGTALQILVGGGAGVVPVWGTDLPTAVTIGAAYIYRAAGTDVPITDGGTGRSTGTTAYALIATGTTATGAQQTLAAAGLTTQILVGGGASALPAWGTDLPTAVTIGSGYIYRAAGTDVPVTDGGTGRSTSTTAYGLITAGTTATGALQTLAAGLATQILVGGGVSALPAWGTDLPTAVTIGSGYIYRVGGTDVSVADGGTGASTLADGGLVCGNGTGAVEVVTPGATTTMLVGGGAATAPVWTTATGSGSPVRATSPTLVTPLLGTPTSGDLSNCTLLTPPAIGETTPNSIRGKNKEVFFTSTDTMDTAEAGGTIVSNYGMTDADMVLTLPAAAEGLSFVCVLPAVRERYVRLTSAGTDKIYLAGVVGTGPGYVGVASGYVTGSSCSVFTFKASDGGYDWFCIPLFGIWVAG